MRTAAQWADDLRDRVGNVAKHPEDVGVLSMGERCAVALVLDKPDLRPSGYTWLDCMNRVEPELLEGCLLLQRERS